MKLEKYLKADNIFIRDNFENTDSFYAEFSLFLKEKGIIVDNEKVKRLFIKRENIQTTAIGRGIAAPHIFSDEFSEFFITMAFIKKGMEYKAQDEQKVHLVFLIMSDERDVGLHLKTLAHIARLTKSTDINECVEDCMNVEHLMELIKKKEALI